MEYLITKLDNIGRGITYVDNKITFVPFTLPNEVVELKLTKITKKYNEGEVTKFITKSENRIEVNCPYYMECGGCNIMHLKYSEQLNYKKEKVSEILEKYSNIKIKPDIIPSDKVFNYRNKITLHYKNNTLGLMKNKTNEVLKIDNCLLVMNEINDYIKNNKINNDIIIRENLNKEIITNNTSDTMIEEVNNMRFIVDALSFFQVNHYICSKVFDLLNDNINECDVCLDLYSGVGTLSIVASKKCKKVYSIELNKNSHINALKNKELNKSYNVDFIEGSVEKEIIKIVDKVDLIITDPPRNGMDKITINTINKLKPKKIIYISCNPITLARDLNLLTDYELVTITLLDMFPNTHHVESFCVLKMK